MNVVFHTKRRGAKFAADDYVNDSPLTGEFLLGYHCQRQDLLRPPKPAADRGDADDTTSETTE